MKRTAIAIFAKAAVPGRVKTRLIGALTAAEAAALHLHLLRDTCALAESLPGCARWMFFAGQPQDIGQTAGALQLGSSWILRPQTGRTLGERLARAFAEMFAAGMRRAVVVGTDTPWMGRRRVLRALSLLRRADVVLGPAADGGYYLAAARRFIPRMFAGIPWGSPRVLAATRLALARAGVRAALLPRDFDLDRASDLARAGQMTRTGLLASPHLERWLAERGAQRIQPPPTTVSPS